MKREIQHIFFDLDHTLWDFESNAHETLEHLFHHHSLQETGIKDHHKFIELYHKHNDVLWDDYRKNKVTKEVLRVERFRRMFSTYDSPDESFLKQFAEEYLELCSSKTGLIDHSIPILDYLKGNYEMHIITNGFEEVQHLKLTNSNLSPYFKEIITSEMAGYRKPDIRIYRFAERLTGAAPSNSIMIGDNLEVDIEGAVNATWHAIHFDQKQKDPRSLGGQLVVNHLSVLKEVL